MSSPDEPYECMTCGETSMPGATTDRLRAGGWRVWRGPSVTGKKLDQALCPKCFKTGIPVKPNKYTIAKDQGELF
jgi:hypothetical protein